MPFHRYHATASSKERKRSLSWPFSFRLPFRSHRKQATTTAEEVKPSVSLVSVTNQTASRPQLTPASVEFGSISSAQAPVDLSTTLTSHTDAVDANPVPGAYGDTALNVLRLVLQALSAATRSVPLPGINLPFDALLAAFDKITVSRRLWLSIRSEI